jgi:endogenous inhibitor of DNA gyrase (YacG/DUF329 family)
LREGTPEKILEVRCPDCGAMIHYHYERFKDDDSATFSVMCDTCHVISQWVMVMNLGKVCA